VRPLSGCLHQTAEVIKPLPITFYSMQLCAVVRVELTLAWNKVEYDWEGVMLDACFGADLGE
jgi:hypothetical protein